MTIQRWEVLVYQDANGRSPYQNWLENLRDQQARSRVLARIDRIRLGNLGDCKPVGQGVWELRIDYGPGYRVYFGQVGSVVVLLLCGGDKRSQRRDIQRAQSYWQDYDANNVAPDEITSNSSKRSAQSVL